MIKSQDRSGWFGASDTSMVVTKNRDTKTFKQWWSIKMGEQENSFTGTKYTEAGNKYEHPILRAINPDIVFDRQIKIEKYLLRVNYDGDLNGIIYEVKTHKAEHEFVVSPQYYRQAQVEMYAYKAMQAELGLPDFQRLYIVSYALYPDEYYTNYDNVEVDPARIRFSEIQYDKSFIKDEYKPNLKYLSRCLRKGKIPT